MGFSHTLPEPRGRPQGDARTIYDESANLEYVEPAGDLQEVSLHKSMGFNE